MTSTGSTACAGGLIYNGAAKRERWRISGDKLREDGKEWGTKVKLDRDSNNLM